MVGSAAITLITLKTLITLITLITLLTLTTIIIIIPTVAEEAPVFSYLLEEDVVYSGAGPAKKVAIVIRVIRVNPNDRNNCHNPNKSDNRNNPL